MSGTVTISTGRISADVDLGRGAEIASLRELTTGTELLLTTPWAESARQLRPVRLAHPAAASEAQWMESYVGGWQTLFPHAGAPAVVDGLERHYHGEASSVAWTLDSASSTSVSAHVELYTVPVRVDRLVTVNGGRITVADTLTNLSESPVAYDYQSHPAFGAPFIEDGCAIETDASTYTPDGRFDAGEFAPGVPMAWPAGDGPADLSRVPGDGERLLRFGWLDGFAHNRVTITNPRLGIAVALEWPEDGREVAWFWQEIHASPAQPWFGRGYAVAVEPSTRVTDTSAAAPHLPPHGTVSYETSLTVQHPRQDVAP